MRHATVCAIQVFALVSTLDEWRSLQACDWSTARGNWRGFSLREAISTSPKYVRETFPTCPTCLMLIDLALSIRAESEQQRINEEIDKERKAS